MDLGMVLSFAINLLLLFTFIFFFPQSVLFQLNGFDRQRTVQLHFCLLVINRSLYEKPLCGRDGHRDENSHTYQFLSVN